MAVCTLHNGEKITGTIDSIRTFAVPGSPSVVALVLTSVTDIEGTSVANKRGGIAKNCSDAVTPDTLRIPLKHIRTLA